VFLIAKYSFLCQLLVDFEILLENIDKFWVSNERKTMPRAAKDLQWGRMRPAGRQFDMPALYVNNFSLIYKNVKSLKMLFSYFKQA